MSWMHAVIDVPAPLHAATGAFWHRALGWPVGQAWPDHPELSSFEPPTGSAYVHRQRVDGAPRVHLDVEANDPERAVEKAVELGAEFVEQHDRWCTLHSPGGLAFCVLAATDHRPPQPTAFPDGHRTRLVQVCIDSPRSVHASEVAFWRALLPGRWVPSSAAEFAGKWHDDAGGPIQLLLQQLEETSGPTRAHLDLGTDDLAAEVRRLVDLGAEDVGPGNGWHVLRDAAGLPFCATNNSPEQTSRRDIG